MNDKIKIFVTGASSQIINQLIDKIDKNKFHICAITRDRDKIKRDDIEIIEGDFLNPTIIEKALVNVKIVIHAAAITHTKKEKEYFRINTEATKQLLQASKKSGVQKFIFISSRTAGLKSGAYGKSKFFAEQTIKQENIDWLIFRPAEVFGVNKGEGIENLILDVFNKKRILYPQGLKSKLFPIYIHDLVDIIYDNIFNKEITRQTITLNGNEGYTYKELIEHIGNIIKKHPKTIPIPKCFMYLIKWGLTLFRINTDITPDQIPRLYSRKETQSLEYKLMGIGEYVKTKRIVYEPEN